MARMAILLAVLALPGCADLALILPPHPHAQMMRGCETRAPVDECSPAAGAFLIRYRWRF